MRPQELFIIGLLTIGLAAQQAQADDWPCYQHDALHTGNSGVVIDPSTVRLSWRASDSYGPVIVVGKKIYASRASFNATIPSVLTSFDLADGAINWTYSVDAFSVSPPAVSGDVIVFTAMSVVNFANSSALYVLDAATGTLKYTVPLEPEMFTAVLLLQNSGNGSLIAYCTSDGTLSAVSLGQTNGAVVWTQSGEFGSIPTIVGNSIIVVGPGQYYAFDQATGAPNQFHSGGVAGGGGAPVVYDASRSQFYVVEMYDDDDLSTKLSAYHYTDNDHISLVWQQKAIGPAVALGSDGKLYAVGLTNILELDPATGLTLLSGTAPFVTSAVPSLSNGVLWIYGSFKTFAYDLGNFQLLSTLDSSPGGGDSLGALVDKHVIVNGNTGSPPGPFSVYAAPPGLSNVPGDISAEAVGPAGAVVSFSSPTAVDADDHDLAVTCSPVSGSTFPLGTTAVTCRATDSRGGAGTAAFNVTIQDTTAPVLQVPADITVAKQKKKKKQSVGALVSFSVTATDTVDGTFAANPDHASGSFFPLGTTTVNVTASDRHGNQAVPKSFTVSVVSKIKKKHK